MKGLLGTSFVLFFLISSGFAWNFLQDDVPTPVYPYPRMVLMGPSGAGKSTLANVLSGCQPNDKTCFETCSGGSSCTHETSVNVVTYLGDEYYGSTTLCDTPGFGDSGEEGDGPIITNIVDVLKHKLGDANIIVLCLDYDDRFGPVIQDMILVLESMLGSTRLWDHVLIEITKWAYTEDAIKSRHRNGVTEESALADINQNIMKISHLNKTLPGVFIDSYAAFDDEQDDQTQQFYYQKYTEELWNMATQTPPLEFLSIEDIMEELNECRITNECLEGRLTKVENDVLNHTDAISQHEDAISQHEGQLTQVENDVLNHTDAISQHEGRLTNVENSVKEHDHDIGRLETRVDTNTLDIETNSGDIDTINTGITTITTDIDTINTDIDTINTDIDTIDTDIDTIDTDIDIIHTIIEFNDKTIQSNTQLIQTNLQTIKANTGKITENTGDIAMFKKAVAVCGYQDYKSDTGTITYDSISGKTTDGSSMMTSGQFKAATTGYYYISFSADTNGRTVIYLYKDGAQQYDTVYGSNQESGEYDMGSRSGVLCLRAGQEIYLEVPTYNTGGIENMNFCVTLEHTSTEC